MPPNPLAIDKEKRTPMYELTAAFVSKGRDFGVYPDWHGLTLAISSEGRLWLWRGMVRGKLRDYPFGAYPNITLVEARERAFAFRQAAECGIDPESVEWPPPPTVERFVNKSGVFPYMSLGREHMKDRERRSLFKRCVHPKIGKMLIRDVTKWHVMWCLDLIWRRDPEDAEWVLDRMWEVMDLAVSEGHRERNPICREGVARNMEVLAIGHRRR